MEPKDEFDKKDNEVRIIVTSDTHGMHDQFDVDNWPKADIFIHAGDFTLDCNQKELQLFREFVQKLPIHHKVVVPGNHELAFRNDYSSNTFSLDEIKKEKEKFNEVCHFLEFQLVEVEGIRILGISRSPAYFDWNFDFAPQQGREVIDKYKGQVDILITHWPPLGILDKINNKQRGGSRGLLNFVTQIGPKIHIFGHIHEGYGFMQKEGVLFYNASSVNRCYQLVNDIFVLHMKRPSKDHQQQDVIR